MTTFELTVAIAVLLITPGPTNTLLAVAGAERGLAGAVRLIPAELAGYLTTVVPLALVGSALLAHVPVLTPVITAVAAVWVAWLAIGFWRMASRAAAGAVAGGPGAPAVQVVTAVTAANIFVTTLLNPKALVFGLVLLPEGPSLPAALGNFVLQIVVVATLWAAFGHVLRQADRSRAGLPPWVQQLAAVWLAIVAAFLAYRVVSV